MIVAAREESYDLLETLQRGWIHVSAGEIPRHGTSS
jgi:hypothetical protein